MASIRKRGSSYEVQIRLKGIQEVKTFSSLSDARNWSFLRENEIKNGHKWVGRGKKLSFLLNEYGENVTPRKKTAKNELYRIARINRSWLADLKVEDIEPRHLQRWIDEESKLKKSASVRRDFVVLSSALEYARKHLRWIQVNPAYDVNKPRNSPSRCRRISPQEIAVITSHLGYADDKPVESINQQMAVAFMLAIETAMRQGEIFNLTWNNVFLDEKYVFLPDTKNGTSRSVPLSKRAIFLLRRREGQSSTKIFTCRQATAETFFRRAVKTLGIPDLHFHDTRHEATTRLSKRYSNVLELAAVTGHKDLRSLQVYYNPTASELADKLD